MTRSLRFVVRRLLHSPLFTIISIATLGVGIGANSAIFSVVNGVLLQPLPFQDADRIVAIWHKAPGMGNREFEQGPSFHLTYREENRVFEEVGMWRTSAGTVTGLFEPERVETLVVTAGVLPVLRVQPFLGRPFSEADDSAGAPETVILSHDYWQSRYGGDPGAVGRTLNIDGRPRDIIGVLPREFRLLDRHPSILVPYRMDRKEISVGNFAHQGIARLKPGVSLDQANADLARVLPMTLQKFPLPPGFSLKMVEDIRLAPNLHFLKQDAVGDVGEALWVLLGTVGIVLLIACANVANLMLVRSEGRQRELAIRSAMGASGKEIAQELMLESLVLGMLGGIVGLFLAYGGLRLLLSLSPGGIPRLEDIAISPVVLVFTLAISVLSGLLFGLLPVFKYVRPNLVSALKEGGRSSGEGKEHHRIRNGLVVAQIGLALVLLVSSGLMVRTFQALSKVSPGFENPLEVLTVRISIPQAEAAEDNRAVRTHEQIMHRIEQVPGVVSVGMSTSVTLDGNTQNDPILVEDFPQPEGQMPVMRRYKWISPNYFATMQNPVRFGRDFTWSDIYNQNPVMIVTENFAREYWKDPARAVGRRIRENSKAPWREIIGVAADVHDDGLQMKATTVAYWPLMVRDYWGQQPVGQRNLVYAIRSSQAGSQGFLKEIQGAIWSVNPKLPLANVRKLDAILEESRARTSFTLTMLGIASGIALLLAVVGIYGVIAYTVSHRTREIGIRIALGAKAGEVRRMFLRHGLLLAGIGIAGGLAMAAGVTRLLSSLLFGVNTLDPLTFIAVAFGLGNVVLLATYLPARRASSVDPVECLRWE
jgi:putative ABC transport system permease protein